MSSALRAQPPRSRATSWWSFCLIADIVCAASVSRSSARRYGIPVRWRRVFDRRSACLRLSSCSVRVLAVERAETSGGFRAPPLSSVAAFSIFSRRHRADARSARAATAPVPCGECAARALHLCGNCPTMCRSSPPGSFLMGSTWRRPTATASGLPQHHNRACLKQHFPIPSTPSPLACSQFTPPPRSISAKFSVAGQDAA